MITIEEINAAKEDATYDKKKLAQLQKIAVDNYQNTTLTQTAGIKRFKVLQSISVGEIMLQAMDLLSQGYTYYHKGSSYMNQVNKIVLIKPSSLQDLDIKEIRKSVEASYEKSINEAQKELDKLISGVKQQENEQAELIAQHQATQKIINSL